MAQSKAKSALEQWTPTLQENPVKLAMSKAEIIATLLTNQLEYNQKNPSDVFIQEDADTPAINTTDNVKNFNPVLISMARRMTPQLIPFDIFGVQPMRAPTGLIFAMRSHYDSKSGVEALFNEADTSKTGKGTQTGDSSGFQIDDFDDGKITANATVAHGLTTAEAERLGAEGGTVWGKMAFSIFQTEVTAQTRAVYADYTTELREDMLNVHGEDADRIIAEILATEMEAAQNREFLRTVNISAKLAGDNSSSQNYVLPKKGIIDVSTNTGGRMLTENWKGLLFWVEVLANQIAKDTRRGKGNFAFMTSNVASAFASLGLMDYAPAMQKLDGNLLVDETTNLFAGYLGNSRMKVFIDPYATVDYITVGYKGGNMDAGIYYAPYVPVELRRTVGTDSFQPRMAMKTRYGLVASPWASINPDGSMKSGRGLGVSENQFYRKVRVDNII